jgi:hypothetical protein
MVDTRDERQIPVTVGLLTLLLGGVATLVVMLMNLQDRFVTTALLDAKLTALSSDIDSKIQRLRSDLLEEIRKPTGEGSGAHK